MYYKSITYKFNNIKTFHKCGAKFWVGDERINNSKRKTKKEGSIRLRLRLPDGRGADLYHKSEIDADLKDLDKFTDAGE